MGCNGLEKLRLHTSVLEVISHRRATVGSTLELEALLEGIDLVVWNDFGG